MNEKEPFEENLNRAFAPHEPSPELRQKVTSLRPRTSRKPLWLACGVAGLAGAGVVVAMIVLPTTSLAQAVIKQASSFEGHLSTFNILPNGHWQRTGDQWLKGGKMRMVDIGPHPSEFLHDPDLGIAIMLNVGMGTISVRDIKTSAQDLLSKKQSGSAMPDTLTPQNMKDFLAGHGIHETPRIEKTEFNGQPADCVDFSIGQYAEDKLYADPTTHRVLGWSYRNTKVWPGNPPENNYTHVCVVDSKPLPHHIFDPVFDIDGVPTDVIAERAKWQERFSKPLKSFAYNLRPRPYLKSMKEGPPVRTIFVRNVMVNPAGDVFVLFSGGDGEYGTNVVPTTIHDSTGGRYKKGISFLPSEIYYGRPENFTFNGEPLLGAWFIRVGGGSLKGPISIGFKQEFEEENNLAFTYTAEPERINTDIPAYMPYMYMPIGTHSKWLAMHTMELAEASDQAKDYAGEERYVRQVIALQGALAREGFYMSADLYCQLADALAKQGKRAEAFETYKKAQTALAHERFDPGPWLKKKIDAGLARLKK